MPEIITKGTSISNQLHMVIIYDYNPENAKCTNEAVGKE